ncbi:MAG: hypothetical protein RMH75_04985 [Archaeoglobaceae archaeon]|nr:hypothetical protein [Archaeoglobaceae archaeon]
MIEKDSPSAESDEGFQFSCKHWRTFHNACLWALVIEAENFYKGLYNLNDDLLDQIFELFVRDFSKFAVELMAKSSATEKQKEFCRRMIKAPIEDQNRFERVLEEVYVLREVYEMNS